MPLRSPAPLGFAFVSAAACVVAVLQPACGFDATGSGDAVATMAADGGGTPRGGDGADGPSTGLDMPAACPADHVMCGADCIDVKSDPSNCSRCGKTCAFDEGCKDGACFLLCAPGTTACGGKCVDLTSDLANCGKCDNCVKASIPGAKQHAHQGPSTAGFKISNFVNHPKFGTGTVERTEKDLVTVLFPSVGYKTLLATAVSPAQAPIA